MSDNSIIRISAYGLSVYQGMVTDLTVLSCKNVYRKSKISCNGIKNIKLKILASDAGGDSSPPLLYQNNNFFKNHNEN